MKLLVVALLGLSLVLAESKYPLAQFHLYQRGKTATELNPADLKSSSFNPQLATRFVVHGWQNNGQSPVCQNLQNAWLVKGDFNVIVVDWGRHSHKTYTVSVEYVPKVGKYLASLIKQLVDEMGAQASDMIIAGHSLGAHVAGFAGKALTGKYALAAIIGMDPASPGFHKREPAHRLAETDAKYVMAIHTETSTLGIHYPVGHADFYPDNGHMQYGCDLNIDCSHARSHNYFAWAIVNGEIEGRRCSSLKEIKNGQCQGRSMEHKVGLAGEPINTDLKGIFWTNHPEDMFN